MIGWRGLIAAAVLAAGAGGATAQARQWHEPTAEERQAAEAELARFTSPTLTRFADEEAFRRYFGAVLAANRARRGWYTGDAPDTFARASRPGEPPSDAVQAICPEIDPLCDASAYGELIIVTGSRIPPPSNPSITNNQMRGVEEGDIVKQIGRFLLVLQDGRIFVVDTRGGGGRRLVLADRADVYRDRQSQIWYDEMLVFGDRVLITGYSYPHRATEMSVFRLDAAGRLGREGVFYLSSNDYYSASNYATRLIDDNLVVYTPFRVSAMGRETFKWPAVRRWTAGEPGDATTRRGRPLFDAAQIYRPVRDTETPTVHTVSVCPLGPVDGQRDLTCRTTAFVGPDAAQWYVTQGDVFLWTASWDLQACDNVSADLYAREPALLYRIAVGGGAPRLVGARGLPPDQFSLHASPGRFRALLGDRPHLCNGEPNPETSLAFLDLPLSSFADTLRDLPAELYTPLPGVGSHYVANRFTDRYLVYGSLEGYRSDLPKRAMAPAYVVPVDRPQDVRGLAIRHSVVRAEQAGNDIVLTGYRDWTGLMVTLIDLDRAPRIASTVRLEQRFESEGRSHAFNSLIEPDGAGIMGLPTVDRATRDARAPWRSDPSDLSYLTVDPQGRLRHVGELERRFDYVDEDDDEDGIARYECEVSCIDWYGNSRPIFTDGRIFALSGTELIEGRFSGGDIAEVQRLNIALASARRREAAATSAAR